MALKDIIGQDRAVNILLRTIRRGRIPSSYLFAGESGIGKKLAAINLAKALNCNSESRTPNSELFFDACDECPSCRKIEKGIHPDFLMIAPEGGQIRIEEIRAVDDALSLKAFEGRFKIVILDEAENMNQFAANAFLKTLEEPPESSLIILVSSIPEFLPDTIRSRCCRINFTPLSPEACSRVISEALEKKEESIEKKAEGGKKSRKAEASGRTSFHDPAGLALLSRLSMGRPGDAVSGDLIEERGWFMKVLESMLNSEKDGWGSREEMERWFDYLLILLRDMAMLRIENQKGRIINSDLVEYIENLSRTLSLKVIIEIYMEMNRLRGYLHYNLNKSLTWNYTGSVLRTRMDIKYA